MSHCGGWKVFLLQAQCQLLFPPSHPPPPLPQLCLGLRPALLLLPYFMMVQNPGPSLELSPDLGLLLLCRLSRGKHVLKRSAFTCFPQPELWIFWLWIAGRLPLLLMKGADPPTHCQLLFHQGKGREDSFRFTCLEFQFFVLPEYSIHGREQGGYF